jgi:hypothetical protein
LGQLEQFQIRPSFLLTFLVIEVSLTELNSRLKMGVLFDNLEKHLVTDINAWIEKIEKINVRNFTHNR